MEEPTQENKPDGWSLRNIKDTRENIVEAISAAQSVPDAAKDFLIYHVNALPFSVRLVRVDAHCHLVNGALVLNAHVGPL